MTSHPQSITGLLKFAKNQGLIQAKASKTHNNDHGNEQSEDSRSKITPLTTNQEILAKNVEKIDSYGDFENSKQGRANKFGGRTVDFADKSNYNPHVALNYYDELGRQVNEKEAFKILSHKFHGKWPGKRKEELRNNKINQQINAFSTIDDTPLNTVDKMRKKQEKEQCAFIKLTKR